MNVGQLDKRLTIQAPALVQDQTTGEMVNTWSTIAVVWSSIDPLRGRERLLGEQVVGETDTRIKIRWSELANRLTSAHRGVYQGAVYNFTNIAQINLGKREVEIMAKSGVNDGR